jgi:hypothetical protein
MYPPQPVPIIATDPNLTGMPMGPMVPPPYAGPMINSPQNFAFIQDPFSEIGQCYGAIIRQQPNLLEAVTGCTAQNRYHVFLQSAYGIKYAFKCNEHSDTCARCCCSSSSRPLKMTIRHVLSYQELDTDLSKIFINIDKPCQCGCLCLCRHYMDVILTDNNQRLGYITEQCTCCDIENKVFDAKGNLRYDVHGDCCQFGLCCGGGGAKKLANIYFEIRQNGNVVGSIKKLSANIGEFFTNADSYQITFPPNATPADKILLIITGLMLDYQNFDNNENNTYHDYRY